MSVLKSVIDSQTVSVDKILIPSALGLQGGSPNITADKSRIAYNLTDNKIYYGNGTTWIDIAGNGAADVVGPASSTDNAIARFDGTTGKLVQNSVVTVSDTGAIAGILSLNGSPVATGTNTGDVSLAAVGAVPNANGSSLTGQALTLQPANASNPGVLSTAQQDIGGVKLFNNGLSFSAGLTGSVPVVNNVFTFFKQANFTGADAPTFSGCCIAGGPAAAVVSNFQSICTIAIGQYIPGAGTYAAGTIAVAFPASANVANPGAMPTEFAPGIIRQGTILVKDGGVVKVGAFTVDALGFLTIGAGMATSGGGALVNFTVNGDNGVYDQVITFF